MDDLSRGLVGPPAFLRRLFLRFDAEMDKTCFPGSLPFVGALDIEFKSSITFFVGENGSGKSTLLEAVAELCRLPAGGGGRNELADSRSYSRQSELAPFLGAAFRKKPSNGYFFRAEHQAHFASLLEYRQSDPDFMGDSFARYGGRSLHSRSHGEAFLEMLTSWISPGIVLMDEPEAALSPQTQLVLLAHMFEQVRYGGIQFIIATHSPILLTFPGAVLLSFDGASVEPIQLEDTSHYQITRRILEDPGMYWQRFADAPKGFD